MEIIKNIIFVAKNNAASESQGVDRYGVREKPRLSKPAVHFHLHRKLPDTHSSVKVNSK